MKIALCLSGQPRGLETNIPILLEKLVFPSNITDIFIHTWFHESCIGKPFGSAQPGQNHRLGVWKKDTVELLQSLNPKKMLIEAPKEFEEFSHLENLESAIQTHLASNAYSVHMANELKRQYETEHNMKYDLVIRTRIDCNYFNSYNIQNYLDINWKHVLHVPHMHQYMREATYYPIRDGGTYLALSDTFVYGTSENVDKFCSMFLAFEEIHYQIKPFQYGEAYFGYQVRHVHKLPISMKHIEYNLSRA